MSPDRRRYTRNRTILGAVMGAGVGALQVPTMGFIMILINLVAGALIYTVCALALYRYVGK